MDTKTNQLAEDAAMRDDERTVQFMAQPDVRAAIRAYHAQMMALRAERAEARQ